MTMKVRVLFPRDFFEDGTIDVFKWINGSVRRCDEFMEAVAAVSRHSLWEQQMRSVPRVCYDVNSDSTYFVFKIDNNGTTFIVGRRLPPTDKGESLDDDNDDEGMVPFAPEQTPSVRAHYEVLGDRVIIRARVK